MENEEDMRGGTGYQVTKVFNESGIFNPGTSKHAEKAIARSEGAKTWSDLGKSLNIYSYRTAEVYKDTWHQAANWCKENLGVRDVEKLQGDHVKAFLESRIADGVKYSTFQRECAALSKFENALNMYADRVGKDSGYNFRETIKEVKAEASQVLDRAVTTRAYETPKALINEIRDPEHKTLVSVQHEGGARINEIWGLEKEDLKGLRIDAYTGETRGYIEVEGKGGKEREIAVSEDTYRNLSALIEEKGKLEFDKNEYRESLKEAALSSDQDYTGSHGLRWNFAQERMEELQEHTNMTYEERLQEVSWEMGHERADITEHYLLR
ncbi:MAG: site-specific integrase [Syntrophales bacterium]|nr:site-specific integrase [Syntrophales bacterium]